MTFMEFYYDLLSQNLAKILGFTKSVIKISNQVT